MTKLKTLKELPVALHLVQGKPYCVSYEDLRAEAIRWVENLNEKHIVMRNQFPETDSRHELYRLNEVEKSILRFWIKMFFNINEADLK